MKSLVIFLLTIGVFWNSLQSQSLVGQEILISKSIANQRLALSADGNIVAVSSPNAGPDEQGIVEVYYLNNNFWEKKGDGIIGENRNDLFGYSVSLSDDGNIIAIGAPRNYSLNDTSGSVQVYQWNGSLWVQKGDNIQGKYTNELFGYSVKLSGDGNTMVCGARNNGELAPFSGQTRVYSWREGKWREKGQFIDGESEGDESGTQVDISKDGNIIAIGAPKNDGKGESAGHVRIYKWNGIEWLQIGMDIDGEDNGDNSGYSLSLSNTGNIIAIGAPYNKGQVPGSFRGTGHIRVYEWDGYYWVKRGVDIDPPINSQLFGSSVSISGDGKYLASRYSNLGTKTIYLTIYDWNGFEYESNCNDFQQFLQTEDVTYSDITAVISRNGNIDASNWYFRASNENHSMILMFSNCKLTGVTTQLVNAVNIYPNPVLETVKINSNEPIQSISICTISGNVVSQNEYINDPRNERELDVSPLSKGMYLVKIRTRKGVGIVKMMKED